MGQGDLLQAVVDPGRRQHVLDAREVGLGERLQVQVRCPAGEAGGTGGVDADELEPPGDDPRRVATGLAHAVVDHQQHPRLGALVVGVEQHGALLQLAAVGLQHQVGDRVHQRLRRVDQARHGLAVDPDLLLLEADALVALEHRGAGLADDPVALADDGGHMADLEASGLAGRISPFMAAKASVKKARMK
jgi:hypothetical protein